MALTPCRECGKEISTTALSCPHCGAATPASAKRGTGRAMWIAIFILVVFLVGFFALGASESNKARQACLAMGAPPDCAVGK